MKSKVIVSVGTGGVGKTSVSAALGVAAALNGRKVLVLTVDPSKRLATSLGVDLKSASISRVILPESLGELSAGVIDSHQIFDQFIRRHAPSSTVDKILKNRLYVQLSTTLSGSQEFTAMEKLLQSRESGQYDLIILDTPPAQHAQDFLSAPQRIQDLFQDSVTKWFVSAKDKTPGFISQLINKGTRTVLKSLEVLTGSAFIEELIEFFDQIGTVQKHLRDRSRAVQNLLRDECTSFVLVTSFDETKLKEANRLIRDLQASQFKLEGVVINRAFPDALDQFTLDRREKWQGTLATFPLFQPSDKVQSMAGSDDIHLTNIDQTMVEFVSFCDKFMQYYQEKYKMYDVFAKNLPEGICMVKVPEFLGDVSGIADLKKLATSLQEKS